MVAGESSSAISTIGLLTCQSFGWVTDGVTGVRHHAVPGGQHTAPLSMWMPWLDM